MASFLITGASGLIGTKLVLKLLSEGHRVNVLVRSPKKFKLISSTNIYAWTHHQVPPAQSLKNIDIVINLAGEGVANKRWTKKQKNKLWDSRVLGTQNLVKAILSLDIKERPKVFISGSAIGIYGSKDDEKINENSELGEDFLAKLCLAWENEALKAQGLRTVLLRTGIVLSKDGGALAKMPPVTIGSGCDWMSWIHIDDMVDFIYMASMTERFSGAYNVTAPNPVQNKEFIHNLTVAKGFPFKLSIPKFLLKLVLGELSTALVASLRVYPVRAQENGFHFTYEEINKALQCIYGKK